MKRPAKRGLSDQEKQFHMDRWEAAHVAGELDLLLDIFLPKLSYLDGVVTTGSCAGHKGGMGFVDLRLSNTMWRWATAYLAELVCQDVIANVKLVYREWPHEDGDTFAMPVFQVWWRHNDLFPAIEAIHSFLINCPPPFPDVE